MSKPEILDETKVPLADVVKRFKAEYGDSLISSLNGLTMRKVLAGQLVIVKINNQHWTLCPPDRKDEVLKTFKTAPRPSGPRTTKPKMSQADRLKAQLEREQAKLAELTN